MASVPTPPTCRLPFVLIFLLVTLLIAAIQFLASSVLQQNSPILLALPIIGGGGLTSFIYLLLRIQCKRRCPVPSENIILIEQLAKQQTNYSRLRRQAAETERRYLALEKKTSDFAPTDITLRRNEAKFQAAFNATPDPTLVLNRLTGTIIDINENFLQLIGKRPQDILDTPTGTVIHWQHPEDAARFAEAMRDGDSVTNLHAKIATNNNQHHYLVSARSVELSGIPSAILVARDITDIEVLRQELANKTEILESVLKHIPYYVFWKNTEHQYQGVNSLFKKEVAPLENMIGRSDHDLGIFPEDAQMYRLEEELIMQTGKAIINQEKTLHFDTGKHRDTLVSKVPLKDKSGNITGVLGIVADISNVRQYERQFRMLLNGIPDPAWLKDRKGNYRIANRALGELVGIPAEELTGKSDYDIMPERDAKRCQMNEAAVIRSGTPLRNDEPFLSDDKARWFEIIRQPFVESSPEGSPEITGTMGIARDISERRNAENEIRKLSRALEQSSAAVVVTTPQGLIEYVNPRYTEITGYLPSEVDGIAPPTLEAADKDMTSQQIWQQVSLGKQWRGDLLSRRKNNDPIWLQASISPVMDDAGRILHAVMVFEDITEKRKQEEYIKHMAMHDGLTDLPNRRLFMNHLKNELAQHKRQGTHFALIFIDLNGFKEINDTYGHDAGDKVLLSVAARLQKALREVDTAARLGGDEFVVLLHNIHSEQDISTAGQRIAKAIEQPITLADGTVCSVSAAIGVAICPIHGTDADELLSKADDAMYRCKKNKEQLFVSWTQ